MLEFPVSQMLWGQAGDLGISRVKDLDTLVSKKKKETCLDIKLIYMNTWKMDNIDGLCNKEN